LYCGDAKGTITRINSLVLRFQDKKQPIFLIRHVHKKDGSDLGRMFDYLGEEEEDFNFKEGTPEVEYDDKLIRPKGVTELTKARYSAFVRTELEKMLRKKSVDRLVICGFMTNFCCESTARDAHDRDYFVDFVVDATGTPGTETRNEGEIRNIVGEFMKTGIARVMTTEEYLKQG